MLPELRFPEFNENPRWKTRKLKDVATKVTSKNKENLVERVLTNSAANGVVDQSDFFDKEIANKSNLDGYTIVEEGDYVYNPRISKIALVGPISKNNIGRGVMSPLYTVFRFNDCKNQIYEHYFKSAHWHSYMHKVSNSGARHDRISITSTEFMDLPLPCTTSEEQEKIADFLFLLDNHINAEQKKLEALQKRKIGLMRLLFPSNIGLTAELRFPRFQDKTGWKTARIIDLFDRIKSKNTENNTNILTISAQEGLISQSSYFNKRIAATDVSDYYLLEKGDFAYNKSYSKGYPMGAIKPLQLYEKGVVSTLYICFRPKPGSIGAFWQHYFDSGIINLELEKIAQEGARNHGLLNIGVNDFFDNVQICFPSVDEQEYIAGFLSSYDDLIFAHFRKVAKLREHKVGLMQKLFPSVDEVTE